MFDAYALVQAQEQLKIERRAVRAVPDPLQGAAGGPAPDAAGPRRASSRTCAGSRTPRQPDEAQIRERLKALQELDTRSAADVKKAYEAIDQVLDLRQQAQFRVFEELMERRKLELVMRARQANRPQAAIGAARRARHVVQFWKFMWRRYLSTSLLGARRSSSRVLHGDVRTVEEGCRRC